MPQERILHKIVFLRNEKVMLDIHLAELYDVETRTLKQSVKRNLDLFPEDFMFMLTDEEADLIVAQNVVPSKKHLGGSKPFAFTETGVAMLSSVLKSAKAREMNIAIMRTFIALRKVALNYSEIFKAMDEIQSKMSDQDSQIELIFEYLKRLEEHRQQENEYQSRRKIGFK
ncbi:MAG: ORF6N domain-containing protein [Bacteroidota bacterium]